MNSSLKNTGRQPFKFFQSHHWVTIPKIYDDYVSLNTLSQCKSLNQAQRWQMFVIGKVIFVCSPLKKLLPASSLKSEMRDLRNTNPAVYTVVVCLPKKKSKTNSIGKISTLTGKLWLRGNFQFDTRFWHIKNAKFSWDLEKLLSLIFHCIKHWLVGFSSHRKWSEVESDEVNKKICYKLKLVMEAFSPVKICWVVHLFCSQVAKISSWVLRWISRDFIRCYAQK